MAEELPATVRNDFAVQTTSQSPTQIIFDLTTTSNQPINFEFSVVTPLPTQSSTVQTFQTFNIADYEPPDPNEGFSVL